MTNKKKLLATVSLSALMLMGCTDNSDVENSEDVIAESVVDEDTEETIVEEDVEETVVKEDVEETSDVSAEVQRQVDGISIVSNQVFLGQYFNDIVEEQDMYNDYLEENNARERVGSVNNISNEIDKVVSEKLNDNPYMVSDDTAIVRIQTQERENKIETLAQHTHLTTIIVINKDFDSFIEENPSELGAEPYLPIFRDYAENIESAEETHQLFVNIFENDTYVVMFRPSNVVLGETSEDMDKSRESMEGYLDYFLSDDVQNIFETYLSE